MVYFFMLQTKFVLGSDLIDLNETLNEALSNIKSENINIKYELDKILAIIEYEIEEAYKGRICCDCAFWDDHGNNESLNGFCTMTGKRMRFNCHACPKFKDLRE